MEQIIAEELEIERKLKQLETKSASSRRNYKINLCEIERPEDLVAIAIQEREKALVRNAQFLQEIDLHIAKLHTKRLCPLQKKLDNLKERSGLKGKQTGNSSTTTTGTRNHNNNNLDSESDPDLRPAPVTTKTVTTTATTITKESMLTLAPVSVPEQTPVD